MGKDAFRSSVGWAWELYILSCRFRFGDEKSKKKLIMDFDNGAEASVGNCVADMVGLDPAEYPIGFFGAHVDAAVTHGCAKVFMPVSAVKGVPLRGEEG